MIYNVLGSKHGCFNCQLSVNCMCTATHPSHVHIHGKMPTFPQSNEVAHESSCAWGYSPAINLNPCNEGLTDNPQWGLARKLGSFCCPWSHRSHRSHSCVIVAELNCKQYRKFENCKQSWIMVHHWELCSVLTLYMPYIFPGSRIIN